MISVKKLGVVLEKTVQGFENEAVLNPAVIKEGNMVHMLYRAVSNNNFSCIGYCKLNGPLTIESRLDIPLLFPQFPYESQGLEDPRIVKIENTYYLSYTAYDGVNALGALALSEDLEHFEKKGIIVLKLTFEEFKRLSQSREKINQKYIRYNEHNRAYENSGEEVYLWDKNVVFFPRKIDGKICFLHRIRPDIQLVVSIQSVDELTPEFWQNYLLQFSDNIVLTPKYAHEVNYIGAGCPPIETEFGWLLIYHGVHDTIRGYVYSACATLLDLNNPQVEIARLPYPLFFPEMEWELEGEVNNVCFPTGTAVFDDDLYIYYGAADKRIACALVSLPDLVKELMSFKITK